MRTILFSTLVLVLAPLADLVLAVSRCFPVVLVVVNLATDLILLPVDLSLLVIGEIAAIGLPVRAHLFVDVRFLLFQILGLVGGQLAGFHAIGDPALLILLALIDLALGESTRV